MQAYSSVGVTDKPVSVVPQVRCVTVVTPVIGIDCAASMQGKAYATLTPGASGLIRAKISCVRE